MEGKSTQYWAGLHDSTFRTKRWRFATRNFLQQGKRKLELISFCGLERKKRLNRGVGERKRRNGRTALLEVGIQSAQK